MAITRAKKEDILAELTDKFKRSKSVVFAANLGLSVKDIADLRAQLREHGIDFRVAKKTLFRKAAEAAKVDGFSQELLDGAVGAAFSYEDEVAPAKLLAKFAKEKKNLALVAGVMEGKTLQKAEVIELSSIPSKEELLAKLLGSMNAPLSGFVGIGNSLVSGLVRVLDQVREQKESLA